MALSPRLLRPRASGGGFDPRSIAELRLWLDATDSSTFSISSGSITQWNDKSTGAYHATQSIGLNQPAYVASGINGRPVVRFDGVNHFLQNSAWFVVGSSPVTIFMAIKVTNPSNARLVCEFGGTSAGARIFFTGERAVRFGNGNVFWGNPMTTAAIATFRSTSAEYGTFAAWTNGLFLSQVSSGSPSNTYNLTQATYSIGVSAAGGSYSQQDLGEFLVYTKSLSDAERERVEAFLLAKWGL
jgi:hypothetical protein